jgi:hypothetical protein
MVQGTDEPGMDHTSVLYTNPEGDQVPYDGVSPVTWRIASYVLAVRDDGMVLVIEPPTVTASRLTCQLRSRKRSPNS